MDMVGERNKGRRDMDKGETLLTVKWWGVMLLVVACFAYLMGVDNRMRDDIGKHGESIAVLQSQLSNIDKTLVGISTVQNEIRQDQIRRFNIELKAGRNSK
jgi:hypothetical protein